MGRHTHTHTHTHIPRRAHSCRPNLCVWRIRMTGHAHGGGHTHTIDGEKKIPRILKPQKSSPDRFSSNRWPTVGENAKRKLGLRIFLGGEEDTCSRFLPTNQTDTHKSQIAADLVRSRKGSTAVPSFRNINSDFYRISLQRRYRRLLASVVRKGSDTTYQK